MSFEALDGGSNMTKKVSSFLFVFTLLLLSGSGAQVPQVISYQGRVAAEGVNFDGQGTFRFALVDATGATTFWSNDGTSVAGSAPTGGVTLPVVKGLYSVLLGDPAVAGMAAIPATAFQHPEVRLRVWFDDGIHGSQLLSPDQRIVAVAYAIMAGEVADGAITAAKIAPGAVGAPQLASDAVQAANVAGGQLVKSVNGLTDAVTLTAGPNVTLTPSGNTLTIAAVNPLATWPGSTSVSTLGTITTGTWQATPLADAAVASAAAWNAKQAGDGTLTLLSGKALSGAGSIVLATQPTLDAPLLANPVVDGPTGKFTLGNGYWWSTAVPYIRPNVAGGVAFDIMPKGPAGGDCWIDICSTDIAADFANFETLQLIKLANGPAYVGAGALGSGVVRDLMLQSTGGRIGVGTPFAGGSGFSPLSLVHLASSGNTDLTLSSAGTGNFSGVRAYHSRGTPAQPLALQAADPLLFVGTRGFDGAAYPSSSDSGIVFQAAENFTVNAHGTRISLETVQPSSITPADPLRRSRLLVDFDVTVATGDLVVGAPGKGLRYKNGANARAGNATLAGGTVTVINTTVTENTIVMVSRQTPGGTLGELSYSVTTNAGAGNGFTITSSSAAETSVVSYHLIESN